MRFPTAIIAAGQAFVAAASMPNVPRQSTAQAFASNEDGTLKFSEVNPPILGPSSPPPGASTWVLSINDTPAGFKQKITGFGGAVTDATVAAYNMLPAAQKQNLIRDLMTPDGANFSLMRHTIASSDLSAAPAYTYADNNGQPDPTLQSFNLGDRGRLMTSMLRDLKAAQPAMKLLGSAWAPSAWMQLDRRLTGGTVDNNLNHTYESAYGSYFAKYLQAYRDEGVELDALTIQNEPLNSNAGMPSLYIFSDEAGRLIRDHVGPAIRAANFTTPIWAYDHNTDRADYPQTVLDINAGNGYVPAVAWHCYATGEDWTALTAFHNANPGVAQFQTECYVADSGNSDTKWNQASWFALGPLQNWAEGSIAWTLGTDNQNGPFLPYRGSCEVCTGLFTVDPAAQTYTLKRAYYMLGQYSRYMPRGATVLSGTGSFSWDDFSGLESVATVNPDGTRSVAIENKFGNEVYVTLSTATGQNWTGAVPAKSVTTWILPAV